MQTLITEPVRLINATYTIDRSDHIILANGTFDVFLYAIDVDDIGHELTIKNIGAGNVTVRANSVGEPIDASSNVVLQPEQTIVCKESNTQWWIIATAAPYDLSVVTDGTTILHDGGVLSVNPVLQLDQLGIGVAPENNVALKVNASMYIVQKDDGESGDNITVDWLLGNERIVTLNAAANIAFTGGRSGGHYVLVLQQDAVGGRIPNWDANILWNRGIIPTLSTLPNAKELIAFYYDGTHYIGAGSAGEPGFRGTASVFQESDVTFFGSTPDDLEFGLEMWDIGGFFTLAQPTRLTIPAGQSGIFSIVASVGWGSIATAVSLYTRIYKTSGGVRSLIVEDSVTVPGSSGGAPFVTPVQADLVAGDYIEVEVEIVNGDATVRGGSSRTFLQLARVG